MAHVDTVNMNINGGSIATDIYAGGYAYGDDAASTVDNATINISNGDIKGNVYAGGKGTATVNNSTINIRGGKIGGTISADQNITGNSALNFTAETGSTIDGAVSGFDTVTSSILQSHNYVDSARKFAVSDLIDFFAKAAIARWKSFRHSCDVLACINFSTVSKKASAVPFGVFKDLFLTCATFKSNPIGNSITLNSLFTT